MTTRRGRILLNSGGGLHILAVDLLVDDTPATLADYYLTNAATEDDVERVHITLCTQTSLARKGLLYGLEN